MKRDVAVFWKWALLAALCVCMVPLFILAAYCYPCADDFRFGLYPHLAFQQTGSVWAALAGAARQVYETYFNWQGTFSAVFLFALQPAVFGEGFYWLCPVVMFAALFWGAVRIFRAGGKVLGAGRKTTDLALLLYLLVCTQLVQSPAQAFYWWNGAVYYVFFYALMLVLAARVLRMLAGARTVRHTAATALLAFFVCGGNYVTALLSLELLALAALAAAWKRRAALKSMLVVFACAGAAFAGNVAAPGNAVRQAADYGGAARPGALGAVLGSFPQAFRFAAEHLSPLVCLALCFLAPFFWRAAGRPEAFRAPLPGLASALAACWFASSFTPTLYAMGTIGPDRVQNIQFFLLVLVLILLEFYWLCWARRTLARGLCARAKAMRLLHRLVPVYLALCALAAVGVVGLYVATGHTEKLACASAARSLWDGTAGRYSALMQTRTEILAGPDEVAVLPRITQQTLVPALFFDDIVSDASDWKNEAMAAYYGKRMVVPEPVP